MPHQAAPEVVEVPAEPHAETDLSPKGKTPAALRALPATPDAGEGLRKAMGKMSPEAEALLAKRKGIPVQKASEPATPATQTPAEPKGPRFMLSPEPEPAEVPSTPAPSAAAAPAAPAESEPALGSKDPKDIMAFRTMRHEIETLRKEVASRPDQASLTKQIQERDAIIERLNLVESPRFKAAFDGPVQQAEQEFSDLAKQWGVDGETVSAVLGAKTMKDRAEAMSGVDPDAKAMLLSSLRAMDAAKARRGAALENWKGTREQIKQQEEAQLLQGREQIANHVLSAMRENGIGLLIPVEGNDKWNAQVAQFEAKVRKAIGSQNPVEMGSYVAHGVLFDVMAEAYQYERGERIRLQNELKLRNGIQPRPGASVESPAAPATVDKAKPMTADDMAKALASKYPSA